MEAKNNIFSRTSKYFYGEKFKPSKLSKYFWMFSATILFVGVILLCIIGFNLGLDFTGGNIITINTGAQIENSETYNQTIRAIDDILKENGIVKGIEREQIVGSGNEASLSFQYRNISGKTTAEMAEISEEIVMALKSDAELAGILTGDLNDMVQQSETKSASASSELLFNSLIALAIAIVAILIYVAIRFELLSGLSAIITLFHDVLMMCALVLIFRIEINASFIAALITILGYSVNNTIVVFDRVRENLKKETLAGKSNMEIADISVKQTLTRTLSTSVTTLLAVILLAVIGVASIREFVIPIIFGLIVGTYAAIFISAPLWAKIITNSRFDKRVNGTFNKSKKDDVVETTAEPI